MTAMFVPYLHLIVFSFVLFNIFTHFRHVFSLTFVLLRGTVLSDPKPCNTLSDNIFLHTHGLEKLRKAAFISEACLKKIVSQQRCDIASLQRAIFACASGLSPTSCIISICQAGQKNTAWLYHFLLFLSFLNVSKGKTFWNQKCIVHSYAMDTKQPQILFLFLTLTLSYLRKLYHREEKRRRSASYHHIHEFDVEEIAYLISLICCGM